MIVERVVFSINPGQEADFLSAVAEARQYPEAIEGFQSMRILRGIESPSTFTALIEWESIDAHMQGFRESESFPKWRALIGPYFASPPDMEHFEDVG